MCEIVIVKKLYTIYSTYVYGIRNTLGIYECLRFYCLNKETVTTEDINLLFMHVYICIYKCIYTMKILHVITLTYHHVLD
jgi:hypothetical protein